MSSNLKVNTILPSTGTNVAIGTAGGSVTMVGNVDIDINSGISTFNDIHISDKIVHEGDTNTSIRFPSADTVTIETAGSERLRIASDGHVRLQKTGANAKLLISRNESVGTDNAAIGVIDFANNTAHTVNARIMAKTSGTGNVGGHLVVETRDPSNSTLAERLRITAGGNVLINGTSSADSNNLLELHQTYGGRIGLARNDTSTAAGNNLGMISFYGNDANGTYQESALIAASADLDHDTGDKPGRLEFYTTPDGSTTPSERLRIDNTGRLLLGSQRTYSDQSYYDDITINNSDGSGASGGTGITLISDSGSWGALLFGDDDDTDVGSIKYDHGNNIMRFTAGTTDTFQLNATTATFAGSVSDSKGDVRQIIYQNKTGAYVLVAADAGKAIHISTGGVTINNSIFSAGDAVTIINNSGSNQTITQGSGVTLYNTGDDGSTGNKTLAPRGMATVWFSSASVAYITGNFA